VHKPAAPSGKDAAQPLHTWISGYVMWLSVLTGGPAGRAPAHLLEPATSATGTAPLIRLLAGCPARSPA